jgi:hypothetical protein
VVEQGDPLGILRWPMAPSTVTRPASTLHMHICVHDFLEL